RPGAVAAVDPARARQLRPRRRGPGPGRRRPGQGHQGADRSTRRGTTGRPRMTTTASPRAPRTRRLAAALALATLAMLPGRAGKLHAQDTALASSRAPAPALALAPTTVLIVRHAERAGGAAGE